MVGQILVTCSSGPIGCSVSGHVLTAAPGGWSVSGHVLTAAPDGWSVSGHVQTAVPVGWSVSIDTFSPQLLVVGQIIVMCKLQFWWLVRFWSSAHCSSRIG